jgi:hypothetical protein
MSPCSYHDRTMSLSRSISEPSLSRTLKPPVAIALPFPAEDTP